MKTLFIVESPGKVKTISKLLGPSYNVQASIGHLRDLPKRNLGVDTNSWKATYENTNEKAIQNLKKNLKLCQKVVLATDDDREGEAIAWHIAKVLNLDVASTDRVTFSEITKSALQKAIAKTHKIDMKKVAAQEARRILDRILGYKVSRPLNLYLAQYGGLSAGRVQSVAVKIVAQRELDILNFVSTEHFKLYGNFAVDGVNFKAEWDYKKHFDNKPPPPTINGGEFEYWTHRSELEKYASDINRSPSCRVIDVEKKSVSRKPPAPFITSSFQMACSNKFKLPPKDSMMIAQKLYEAGYITYMRTDNPNLSEETIEHVNSYIEEWCKEKGFEPYKYKLDKPNTWKAKGDAQEAHEAIRPTSFDKDGEDITDPVQKKVYQLIFKRTVACQMASAVYDNTKALIETSAKSGHKNIALTAKGNVLKFSGWKAFISGDDSDIEENDDEQSSELPDIVTGETFDCSKSVIEVKNTKPPSRFTEASLIKALESNGIGRPSTYASIMSTILTRNYIEVVDKKNNKLGATERGIDVFKVLDESFSFMNIDYTKKTEEYLDKIAKGNLGFKTFMVDFYSNFESEAGSFIKSANKNSTAPDCPGCNMRKMVKIKNKKRPGHTWLCDGYMSGECKTAYPDKNGSPDFSYKPPMITEHKCPSCSGALTRYMYESNFSYGCKPCSIRIKGTEHKPDFDAYHELQEQKKTALTCPSCNKGKLLKRSGKNGPFFTCDAYPKCSTAIGCNDKGHPDIDAYNEKKAAREKAPVCKKCKKGRIVPKCGGKFFGCDRYPSCKFKQQELETA